MYLLSKTQQARTGLIRKALSVPMKHHNCTGLARNSLRFSLIILCYNLKFFAKCLHKTDIYESNVTFYMLSVLFLFKHDYIDVIQH